MALGRGKLLWYIANEKKAFAICRHGSLKFQAGIHPLGRFPFVFGTLAVS